MTLGIEREGLAEPLREFVARGHARARHLRRPDHARPRPPRPARRDARGATPSGASSQRSRRTSTATGSGPLHAVFIRAPWVEEHGDGVEVLAEVDGHPVAVRQGNILAVAFHPELTDDRRAAPLARSTSARAARMRDQRAEALAQILVRYSTRVQKGDVCVIQGDDRGRAARAGGLRGGAARRRAARSSSCTTDGAQAAVLRARLGRRSSTGSRRPPQWAAENADVRIAIMADVEHARAVAAPTRRSRRARQKARKPLMETMMQPRRRGRATAGR